MLLGERDKVKTEFEKVQSELKHTEEQKKILAIKLVQLQAQYEKLGEIIEAQNK